MVSQIQHKNRTVGWIAKIKVEKRYFHYEICWRVWLRYKTTSWFQSGVYQKQPPSWKTLDNFVIVNEHFHVKHKKIILLKTHLLTDVYWKDSSNCGYIINHRFSHKSSNQLANWLISANTKISSLDVHI